MGSFKLCIKGAKGNYLALALAKVASIKQTTCQVKVATPYFYVMMNNSSQRYLHLLDTIYLIALIPMSNFTLNTRKYTIQDLED